MKKIIASAVAGTIALTSVAAAAAPIAFQSATRTASPVAGAENLGEDASEIWVAIIFALVAAGIIVLIENEEDDIDDLPASP